MVARGPHLPQPPHPLVIRQIQPLHRPLGGVEHQQNLVPIRQQHRKARRLQLFQIDQTPRPIKPAMFPLDLAPDHGRFPL